MLESGQEKELLVLRAGSWDVSARIPLNGLGPRFFRSHDLATLQAAGESAAAGDRVVFRQKAGAAASAVDDDAQQTAIAAAAAEMRARGVAVDIRAPPPAAASTAPAAAADADDTHLSPRSEYAAYASALGVPEPTRRLALEVLAATVDNQTLAQPSSLSSYTRLALDSVDARAFGPFGGSASLDLAARGLVLLRGSNADGTAAASADSNGSGKSTLAMAPLWCLTGLMDERPTNDGKVTDVVHDRLPDAAAAAAVEDGSKKRAKAKRPVAEVTVRGSVNGKSLVVTRRKGKSVTQLFVELDGNDETRQTVRDTQAVLDEIVGATPSVLRRSVFFGQHLLNGLLEATDAALKTELTGALPAGPWREAASDARREGRAAAGEAERQKAKSEMRTADAAAVEAGELLAAENAVAAAVAALAAGAAVDGDVVAMGPPPDETAAKDARADSDHTALQYDAAAAAAADAAAVLRAARAERRLWTADAGTCSSCGQPISEAASRDRSAALDAALDAAAEAAAAADKTARRWLLSRQSAAAHAATAYAQYARESADAAAAVARAESGRAVDAARLVDAVAAARAAVTAAAERAAQLRTDSAGAAEEAAAWGKRAAALDLVTDSFGPRGIQAWTLRSAVAQLEGNARRYLDAFTDGTLDLSLALDVENDRIVKRVAVSDGGELRDRALSQLSGGQWRRVSLALSFGFSDLLQQRAAFSCNLMVLDEVLAHLDHAGRRRVANVLLRDVAKGGGGEERGSVFLIMQDAAADELLNIFDAVEEVQRRGGSSVLLESRRGS